MTGYLRRHSKCKKIDKNVLQCEDLIKQHGLDIIGNYIGQHKVIELNERIIAVGHRPIQALTFIFYVANLY
jgi:hypothetical protein